MSVSSAVNAGRRAALARMTSRATIKREDPSNPTTDANGFEVPGWATVYVDLPGWIDKAGPHSGTRTANVGGVEVQLATRVFKAPHDTTLVQDGDVVKMSGGACDGRFYRIVESSPAEQKKQQEFPVIETQQPAGWV